MFRLPIAAALVAAPLLAASLTDAAAITASTFTYATPKTGYLAIAPQAFHAYDPQSVSAFVNAFASYGLNGEGCFRADLQLPDGARITKIRFNYRKRLQYYVRSTLFETGNGSLVDQAVKTSSAPGRAGYTVTYINPLVVDNSNQKRDLLVCLSAADDAFFGALVTYTYTDAGD